MKRPPSKNTSLPKKTITKSNGTNEFSFKKDLFPLAIIVAYIAVDFIPELGSTDVMGSQWPYLTVINILGILYLLSNKHNTGQALQSIFKKILPFIFIALMIVAGVSIFFAINKIESLVCYARFLNVGIMFFNLSLILFGRLHLLKTVAILLSFFLLIQSVNTILQFYDGLGDQRLDKLIYSIKGKAGNKNILAVSLLLKLPFVLFCLSQSNTWKKIFYAMIILLACLSIFILNARTSYLGLIVIFVVFALFSFLLAHKKVPIKTTLLNVSIPLGFIVIALLASQLILKNALSLDEENFSSYGTVTQRLASIANSGENPRWLQWSTAIDYIKKNPIKGAGFGNWKLASIPYEKTYVDDFVVTYHVHNDFLEFSAETGVIGGLLLAGLFICLLIYILKTIFSTKANDSKKQTAVLSLMLLAGYFIDASLNFPAERPIMQVFFCLCMATGFNCFLSLNINNTNKNRSSKLIYGLISLALLLPALYITYQTYRSLKVQALVNQDMKEAQPLTRADDIKNAFPAIPNMNAYCFPITDIRAFYLMNEKRYDEALPLLNKEQSEKINPYLQLNEYLKAKLFFETKNYDSAFYYARTSFFAKPRVRISFFILNQICIQRKDSITAKQAFEEHVKYRDQAWAWNCYAETLMRIPVYKNSIQKFLDSALTRFPGDTDLVAKRSALQQYEQPLVNTETDSIFRQYFNKGLELFSQKLYEQAAQNFLKAYDLNPGQYLSLENTGLCYYSMSNYTKALIYFDRVIQSKSSTDGKAEFLKGVCLLNLGNKTAGCQSLYTADKKHYPEAKAIIKKNCN
jgi:O-antigen ligase/tetratricopeptide (TPR) repeat protein